MKKEILSLTIRWLMSIVILGLPFIPYWLTTFPEVTPQEYTLWQNIVIWVLVLPFFISWFEISFKLGEKLWGKIRKRIPYFEDMKDIKY